MIQDYFNLALKNLRRKKLRSWLTILGILISIMIIFFLISLSFGLSNAINEQFKMLGSDKFFIMAKGQLGAPGTGGAVQLTTKDVEIVEKVLGVKTATYFVAGNAKVEFNDKSRYFMVIGIPMDKTDALELIAESANLKADDGRLIAKKDLGKVMIGYDYAYNNVFGHLVRAGDTLVINGKEFKVVGILSRIGNPQDDKNIYMIMEDFKELFNSGDRVDEILVQVQNENEIKQVAEKTKQKLMKFRDVTEKTIDFTVLTPEELLASIGIILNVITAFLVGVAGISLLVGSVGIANTMYTSVLERTKEIGTMKAVGARNSDILYIFVIESGLLGLVGGIIGIIFGFLLGKGVEYVAVNQFNTTLLQVATPFYLFAGCLGFAFLI
ncbi:MAG: ABC transporter permease, partial [Nanoarchaeota archaeon]